MKKRMLILICILLLVPLLCGCQSKAAKTVDQEILALGDITLSRKDAVEEARANYDRLPGKDKKTVKNAELLVKAETDLLILQVEDAIENIPRISLEVKETLDEIRSMYERIPVDRQPEVTNYSKLLRAEEGWNVEAYAEAQRLEADRCLAEAYQIYSMLPDDYEDTHERKEALAEPILLARRRALLFGNWVWDGENAEASNGITYAADFTSFSFYQADAATALEMGLYEETFAAGYDAIRTDLEARASGALETMFPKVGDCMGQLAVESNVIYNDTVFDEENEVLTVTDIYTSSSGSTINKAYAMDFHLQKDGVLRVEVTLAERNKDDITFSLYYTKQ
ncbi:MAG: hypothetical protein IJQ02_06955 [Oscillospiraceae bacterium]|nr:hypothetical protein [Oscillospiraceae bacterium]